MNLLVILNKQSIFYRQLKQKTDQYISFSPSSESKPYSPNSPNSLISNIDLIKRRHLLLYSPNDVTLFYGAINHACRIPWNARTAARYHICRQFLSHLQTAHAY